MMKILIENHGPAEFEYSPEATVNDIRKFAAEKLGCQATNLNVRKNTVVDSLRVTSTLIELGITEKDVLKVRKTTRNNEGNAKKKFQSGKAHIHLALKELQI